ncbi:MAG: ATP-binding protein [Muribaculaceae bacterium]|nr:ATP-binding protein [Muribaculaceae bacterium]
MMLILVGQRRVGKSYILLQMQDKLKTLYPDSNIIYINKEWHSYHEIETSSQLYEYVTGLLLPNQRNYLLIDEVQDIENYEVALRNLYAENRCQIIATGSNAKIFSSEISSKLSGRYIEIPIYPLSFREFLIFQNLEDSEDALIKFMRVGGLPGLSLFDINNEQQVTDYLQGVFSTVIMKDIILREKIRNVTFLENLITFISDNIGKLFSYKTVTNTMNSKGEKVSEMLTSSYIKYFKQALLLHPVLRYDIHGKKIFEQIHKFYFTDHGLRNLLAGFNIRGSIEKIMENVIYNQLLISGYKVYVGQLRTTEIDFIAEKNGERLYIQSTYMLGSQTTIDREFGNLFAIPDRYPKIVVSMDSVTGEIPEYPGIRHISLREFLKTY